MNILIFAPHPDDEILGCGGIIAKHIATGSDVYVCIVTRGYPPILKKESTFLKVREEVAQVHEYLGIKQTIFLDFPAVMLETIPRYKLNEGIFKVIQEVRPNEVYIPHRGDMQLDHKMIVDAAMVALRPKYQHIVERIYSYETLSETGWDIPNTVNDFIPNVYSDITEYIQMKLDALAMYKTQVADFPNPRSLEAIEALAKYRGATVGVKAAEAFSLVREIKLK